MERDTYFDNAKFFLILLVVVGHIIAPLIGRDGIVRALYVFIYTFHMPMFALLSGFFSTADASIEYFTKGFLKFLVPYFIFQSILVFLEGNFAVDKTVDLSLLEPFNAMWYLFSLFSWRAILPFFSRLRYPIVLSFAIALLAGYCNYIDRYLSLSRTMVFFPYFIVGYYLKEYGSVQLRKIVPKQIALCILFLVGCMSVIFRWVDLKWIWNGDPYHLMGHTEWYAAVFRLPVLFVGFIVGFAFLSLVPHSKSYITRIGRRTMYVYLLHFLIVRSLVHMGFYSKFTSPLSLQILIPMGIILTLLLSSDVVIKTTMPLVEPLSFLRRLQNRRSSPKLG